MYSGASSDLDINVISTSQEVMSVLSAVSAVPPILLNAEDPSEWGWGFGPAPKEEAVSFSFVGNGSSRWLHVTGYDIDLVDEACISINGVALDCLATGPDG